MAEDKKNISLTHLLIHSWWEFRNGLIHIFSPTVFFDIGSALQMDSKLQIAKLWLYVINANVARSWSFWSEKQTNVANRWN